jgi:hypothetical protein
MQTYRLAAHEEDEEPNVSFQILQRSMQMYREDLCEMEHLFDNRQSKST